MAGRRRGVAVAAVAATLAAAGAADAVGEAQSAFSLRSSAFRNGAAIPVVHTCEGRNVSPPLAWPSPPARTRSLALLVDDPDAPRGTFTHWIAWGIGSSARALGQGKAPPGQGVNDAGRIGYLGPCPPPGDGAHRYVFRLYALDTVLKLPRGAPRAAFQAAIRGHVLAVGRLVGIYER